ncbi:hypothetical protein EDB86DRAFT_1476722 [Lactarius hatsudake]|nr:hypothetical protein EDB86DRAFT_1476722 [Lactarius hatsudake]
MKRSLGTAFLPSLLGASILRPILQPMRKHGHAFLPSLFGVPPSATHQATNDEREQLFLPLAGVPPPQPIERQMKKNGHSSSSLPRTWALPLRGNRPWAPSPLGTFSNFLG